MLHAKGVPHFPVWIPHARLPVKICLAQKLLKNPTVDVTAVVVAHVDDESLSIEHGVEFAFPLRHVGAGHRAEGT
jgi:hypothetical protein